MKTICVVTGTRAEYGILRPVMRAIAASELLKLQLIVTGMHLEAAPEFGGTVTQVEADGFAIDARIPLSPEDDTMSEMGRAIGRGIPGMIDAVTALSPDAVLVLGDRIEAFAAGIATVFCGRCLVHLHGGERSRGGFDEVMRHAITKLAHVHFAATEVSMERIIRMGEREENVYLVGAPGLDEALAGPCSDSKKLGAELEVDLSTPPIVVVQHPVSTRPKDASAEMIETMEAVIAEDAPVIVIHPNNDAGCRGVIEVIGRYAQRANVHTFASLPRTDFLSLMRCAGVLVGNSSSGIIEAPSFGLPVVNVGERQADRQRASNVIDVEPERGAIRVAVRKCLYDKDFRKSVCEAENPWGDGHASQRIVEILGEMMIDRALLEKHIVY